LWGKTGPKPPLKGTVGAPAFGWLERSGNSSQARRAPWRGITCQRALEYDQTLIRGTERIDIINHLGISDPASGKGPQQPMAKVIAAYVEAGLARDEAKLAKRAATRIENAQPAA
jgi:hypothetical protein